MNPDEPLTPREELEIRITALLMGQLPPEEAAELLRTIAADPELTALYSRMRHAVELLREARSLPEQPAPEIPLQLSEERRAALLAKFRGLKPMPPLESVPTFKVVPSPKTILASPPKKKRDWKWVVPVGIAASITILGGGFLLSALVAPKYAVFNEAPDFVPEAGDGSASFESSAPQAAPADALSSTVSTKRFGYTVKTDTRELSSATGTSGKEALARGWASFSGAIRGFDSKSDTRPYALYAGTTDGRKLADSPTPSRRASALYMPKAEPELGQASESRFGANADVSFFAQNAPSSGEAKPPTSAPQRPVIALGRQSVPQSEAKFASAPKPVEVDGTSAHWQLKQAPANRPTVPAEPVTNGAFAVINSDFTLAPSKAVNATSAPVDEMARDKRVADAAGAAQWDTAHATTTTESGVVKDGDRARLKAGKQAGIEIIREFPYPTEFEVPQIPANFGKIGSLKSESFPVTQTAPTASVSEPHTLSEPLSTAGKVNVAKPIAAFKGKPAAVSGPAKPSTALGLAATPQAPPPALPTPVAAPTFATSSEPSSLTETSIANPEKLRFSEPLSTAPVEDDSRLALTSGTVRLQKQASRGEVAKSEKMPDSSARGLAENELEGSAAKLAEVKQSDPEAKNFTDLGRYNLADKEAAKVLNVDKYNKAAENQRQSVAEGENKLGEVAYSSARSEAMWDVKPQQKDDGVALQKELKERDFDSDALALGGKVVTGSGTLQIGNPVEKLKAPRGGVAANAAAVGIATAEPAGRPVVIDPQAASVAPDLAGFATGGGIAKLNTASGNTFWDDVPQAEGAKPAKDAQQWFGRTSGGVGGANGRMPYSRGGNGHEESSDYFFRPDAGAVAGDKAVDVNGGTALGKNFTGGILGTTRGRGTVANGKDSGGVDGERADDFGTIALGEIPKAMMRQQFGNRMPKKELSLDAKNSPPSALSFEASTNVPSYNESPFADANDDSGTIPDEKGRKLADTSGKVTGNAALNFSGVANGYFAGGQAVAPGVTGAKVGIDGYSIDMDLAPQAVEFEGFINYGSPVQFFSVDENGNQDENVITPSVINGPVAYQRQIWGLGPMPVTGAPLNNIQDKIAQLGDVAFSLPAPGDPTAANDEGKPADSPAATRFSRNIRLDGLSDTLAAIKLPALDNVESKLEQPVAEQVVEAKPEAELQKKQMAKAEPPAPPQKIEPPVPQPEVLAKDNAFSTFSLNVSDVSFKLAQGSLEKSAMPDVASVRVEEFINALDYRDPEPLPGAPLAFASERARYPFAHNRDLLRLSVKTAAEGRQAGRPLNLVLLLDNSGSMERADRVRILQEALTVLAKQLQPQDKLSIITFSRTPRLWADGVSGDKAGEFTGRVAEIRPEGGTDLGAAMDLGYTTALKHYQVGSVNRVVLLTDGAANLGNVDAASLKGKVEKHRKQGVAFDCFGVGWEGYNDDLLEQLSRNGDGRYGFINTPEAAATEFAGALAGALRVAASDVKVQVEFNPKRVTSYRQLGYAKHQLKKEQFRDNTVDAAEIGAAEAGNALYTLELDPRGQGDIATVRVRFKVPGTTDYKEHEWTVPFTAPAPAMEQSSSSLRLAATAGAFGEFLAQSPFAAEVNTDKLLGMINGIPAIYGADPRPGKLEWMIRQAKSISGR